MINDFTEFILSLHPKRPHGCYVMLENKINWISIDKPVITMERNFKLDKIISIDNQYKVPTWRNNRFLCMVQLSFGSHGPVFIF